VRTPALTLKQDLATLVTSCVRPPRSIPSGARSQFVELMEAFRRSRSISVPERVESYRVSDAPIPSSWIRKYRLADGDMSNIAARAFTALVQFGSDHNTDAHIEECAAATYGYLVEGEKVWEFLEGGSVVASFTQMAGDTLYLPPGCIHRVQTTSNGAILIGETYIVSGSIQAFARRAAALQQGRIGGQVYNPDPEAQKICESLMVAVSARLGKRTNTWYGSAATKAVCVAAAQEAGGSLRLDALGRRKRKRCYSSKDSKQVRKARKFQNQ